MQSAGVQTSSAAPAPAGTAMQSAGAQTAPPGRKAEAGTQARPARWQRGGGGGRFGTATERRQFFFEAAERAAARRIRAEDSANWSRGEDRWAQWGQREGDDAWRRGQWQEWQG